MSLQLWILPPIVAFAAPTYFIPSSFSSFYSIRWLTRLILSWIAELLTPKQTEVTTAQADFTDKISSLVQTFFPPSSQSFPAGKALSWISAILAIVFGIGAFLDPTPEGKALSAGIAAAGGLINAGVTMDVNTIAKTLARACGTRSQLGQIRLFSEVKMRTIRPFCKCEGVLMSPVFDAAEDCPLTWSLAITYKMGHSPTLALSHPRVQLKHSG